jgi:protein-S-isoprenylcysteine O-methyltransferase Ste14
MQGHEEHPMNIRLVLSRCLVVGAIAFACLGATRWHTHSPVSLALESTSVGFLLAGAIGRIWCSVHIAGRKNALVVAQGPYSVCRNPLYFFSMFAFMGAGLAFESFTAFAIFAAVFFATHWPTILSEERFLRESFGADYDAYCARVPRFLPKPSLYQAPPTLTVDTHVFTKSLRESGLIPLAFVGGQAVVLAHEAGVLPSFFTMW